MKVSTRTAVDMLRLFERVTFFAFLIESFLSISEHRLLRSTFDMNGDLAFAIVFVKACAIMLLVCGIFDHILIKAYNKRLSIEATRFTNILYTANVVEEDDMTDLVQEIHEIHLAQKEQK